MTAITNQKYDAQRRIIALQKQRLELDPQQAQRIAIAMTAHHALTLTLADLLEWERQLQQTVTELEKAANS